MIDNHARFLLQDEFLRHCEALGMETGPFGDELEFYESEGALFPAFRIIKPEEYVRYFWQMEHDPTHPFYGKDKCEYPDQWAELHEALTSLHFPRTPRSREFDADLTHVLDRLPNTTAFLQRLVRSVDYRPWQSYKVDTGEYQGYPMQRSMKEDYYQYWQSYEVFEIRQCRGVHARAVSVSRNQDGSWNYRPWRGSAGLGTWPYELRRDGRRCFEGWLEYFDTLSYFLDLLDQEEARAFAPFYWGIRPADADGMFRLTDTETGQLAERHNASAARALCLHRLSTDQWMAFLRDLAKLHYRFDQVHELALAESVRVDLRYAADLISRVTKWSEDEIAEKVGSIGLMLFKPKTYWRKVFPVNEDKSLERVMRELQEHREDFNQHARPYALDEADVNGLVEFMKKSGTWSRLSGTIDSLYAHWFDLGDPRRTEELHQDIVELAAFPEHFWKALAPWVSDAQLSQGLLDAYTFEGAFKTFFGRAKDQGLSEQVFQWVCQRKPGTIRTAAEFDAEWRTGSLDAEANGWRLYVTNSILICLLVRNYAIHNLPSQADVFQGRYRKILDSVYSTIFVTWSYLQKSGTAK